MLQLNFYSVEISGWCQQVEHDLRTLSIWQNWPAKTGHLERLTLQRIQINILGGWYILLQKNARDYHASVPSNCCIFFANWRVWPASANKRKAPLVSTQKCKFPSCWFFSQQKACRPFKGENLSKPNISSVPLWVARRPSRITRYGACVCYRTLRRSC